MAVAASAKIHASAVIEEGAQIGENAEIGPFCVVGPDVKLAAGVVLKSHVVIAGDTEIGAETVIFPFASIGEIPQDLKYDGAKTKLVIGARNRIREYVTMNPGTTGGGGLTSVGDDGLYMAGTHVAHDCHVGNYVIMVNNSGLAGHCVVEDDVIIGGLSGVHQWVRIGRGAIIGGCAKVTNDVIPHGLIQGPKGELEGLNLVGLKRRGVSRADITALRAAFLTLKQGEGSFQERAVRIGQETESDYVQDVIRFITADSDRSFHTPA